MENMFADTDPASCVGNEFHATDYKPPIEPRTTSLPDHEVLSWLSAPSKESSCAVRLISYRTKVLPSTGTESPLPFTSEVSKLAIWSVGDYCNLWQNPAGGSAALLSDSRRFIMQTPIDSGSFCSFAISMHRNVIKGVYTYNDPQYEPSRILAGETIQSGWMSAGLHIISLPQAFLKAHSAQTAKSLAVIVGKVNFVEKTLSELPPITDSSETSPLHGFAPLSRTLHTCSTALMNLERRSKFESGLIKSIEAVITARYKGDPGTPWGPIEIQRNMIAMREYDFEVLPKRIQEQRSTIFNLIVQHNQQVNLEIGRANVEIAESSRRIAEATMSDSASMKTIAILTMVFLPGTAVASFFSINMFNWSPSSGQGVVSRYLWIYFVAAIPLTAMVLAVWWVCGRRRGSELRRRSAQAFSMSVSATDNGNMPRSAEEVEMQQFSDQEDLEDPAKV